MRTAANALFFVFSLLLFAAILLWLKSPLNTEVWEPGQNPGLIGAFAANEHLAEAQLLLQGEGVGPEDVAYGSDGWIYTGYADGRIVRFRAEQASTSVEVFANTGGRPLGLAFDKHGALIVADADKGLLSISPDRDITVLADSYLGQALRFVDDLDIAKDGTIWFSDASQRFGFEENIYNFLEPSFSGRLFSYDPAGASVTLHMDGLFFANGVALGPDENFVLVNETGMARIHRLWLKGPRKGQRDIFIENLPGMPDNLSFNGDDRFWVALVNLRLPILDDAARFPLARKILGGLPPSLMQPSAHYGFVIGLDAKGEVVANMQSSSAQMHSITSVNQYADTLYFGSLTMDAMARMPVPE